MQKSAVRYLDPWPNAIKLSASPRRSTMAASIPDPQRTLDLISEQWDADIVPQLIDYIRIPAKSPSFDAQWEQHGHIEAAIQQAHAWVARQKIAGLTLEIVRLANRTPVLFFDLPATGGGDDVSTVLLY